MEGGSQTNMDAVLAELSNLLAELEEQPENIFFLRRQIVLMRSLGMTAEVLDVYAKLSSLIMLQEEEWLTYLDDFVNNAVKPLDVTAFMDIMEKYVQAERDYLSLSIILQHVKFIIACFKAGHTPQSSEEALEVPVDEEVSAFLDVGTTRGLIKAAVDLGNGLLSESQQLWQLWIDWELRLLEGAKGTEKQEAIESVHDVYLQRLAIPHSTIDQTTSSYSSFCSTYCNEEYEQRLVKATEASQTAKYKWSGERRAGKSREDFELQILYATDLAAQAQVFVEYYKWESNARIKPTAHGKGPNVDITLTRAVFERAVVPYAKLAAMTQSSLDEINLQLQKQSKSKKGKAKGKKKEDELEATTLAEQKQMAEEAIRAYKDAEAGIWAKYASWSEEAIHAMTGTEVRKKAVRAVPHCGGAWADLFQDTQLDSLFETALSLGLLFIPEGRTTEITELFLARAAYEARLASVNVALGAVHPTLATITRGLETITKVNKSGDASLKLEKFALDWAETIAPEYLDQTLLVLDKPVKCRSSSYQFALLRANVEVRRDDVDRAREIFEKSIQRTDLDWPEAIYEAFIQLEVVHGTPQTLQDTRKKIEKEQEKVAKRREKAAAEANAYQEQYTTAAIQGAAAGAVDAVMGDGESKGADPTQEATDMAVAASADLSAAPVAVVQSGKDNGEEVHLKRDREHTTVLCGPVRETTILVDEDAMHDSALVEFKKAEAIPDVLEKDKKKFEGTPVSISMLWRSTLFVTNFPREMDDGGIRNLFRQYGRILETRWPSRKYADSRRFCYVTMESPAVAQEALVLHDYKVPGASTNFGLTVLISDPSAKTKRSDAANSTLFVGGLNSKSTEVDIKGLFNEFGTISHIKLGWDPLKRICKGFAFVEMSTEAEAKAALKLHGTQYKGKYLKVEISDPNHANKKSQERKPDQAAEKRLRSVRLSNLPEGTQEGLLQQALEKIVPVRRLEMFVRSHEALAELESQADVGKLLLRTEPFIFNGNEITFTEQNKRLPPAKEIKEDSGNDRNVKLSSTPSGPSTMFAPRAARKALAKPRPTAVAAAKAVAASPGISAQGQDDFRALVAAKNKQREEKLNSAREGSSTSGEKRKLEDGQEGEESKRTRT
ncbi:hypothetical protein CNBB1950 [Cryptococcus deneoformans B-3501A]|uniref:hypothetical protein n=1 Tax=Cryptococcus deneoformans (strain B-3501A) TaxID=283643 RepID=UPI000042C6B6|nr:hypothetical protein CNBB1950 [Cryptococcus neoformans var. neoformans B-3501A]EAL22747.1 hypothetical protein CNBB1950 [Cryptococcus neoformans var. neoformans B-3501A]